MPKPVVGVANTESCIIGNMICKCCGRKIERGLFLTFHYDISFRGIEDNYCNVYHADCLPDHPKLKEYRETINKKNDINNLQKGYYWVKHYNHARLMILYWNGHRFEKFKSDPRIHDEIDFDSIEKVEYKHF